MPIGRLITVFDRFTLPRNLLLPGEKSPHENFMRLHLFRALVLLLIGLLIWLAEIWLKLALPFENILLVIAWLGLTLLIGYWRLFTNRSRGESEIFIYLLSDTLAITALLYYAEGASNPFVSYYLLLLAIASATIRATYVWLLTLLAVACYSGLMWLVEPSPHANHNFNLHLWGMWASFMVSATLLGLFGSRMAESLRKYQRQLAKSRENTLRDEQILAIGAMAANTAHELGTPLSTIAVVLSDMALSADQGSELGEDIELLQGQLSVCQEKLAKLKQQADLTKDEPDTVEFSHYIHDILNQWQVIRPSAHYTLTVDADNSPLFHPLPTLRHGLLNLLNNAADVSPDAVSIHLSWTPEWLQISIKDQGPGLSKQQKKLLGKPFQSSKRNGLGIGFFLANATIERMGGVIRLADNEASGTLLLISFPNHSNSTQPEATL